MGMSKNSRRRSWRQRRSIPPPEQPQPVEPIESPRSDVVTAAGLHCVIGVLSAGLDSLELQNWAMDTLIPRDSEGLGDFLAALYVMARVLLGEVGDATGQPREEILQRLALTVENGRGKPLPGW